MKRSIAPRKVAEWTTLLLSIMLIGALTVYLILDLRSPASPYVELAVRAEYGEVRQVGSRYVLPIDVENKGDKAVGRANIRITIQGPHGAQTDDFEIQYLGKRSKTRIYRYFDRDPRTFKVEISPTHYAFE